MAHANRLARALRDYVPPDPEPDFPGTEIGDAASNADLLGIDAAAQADEPPEPVNRTDAAVEMEAALIRDLHTLTSTLDSPRRARGKPVRPQLPNEEAGEPRRRRQSPYAPPERTVSPRVPANDARYDGGESTLRAFARQDPSEEPAPDEPEPAPSHWEQPGTSRARKLIRRERGVLRPQYVAAGLLIAMATGVGAVLLYRSLAPDRPPGDRANVESASVADPVPGSIAPPAKLGTGSVASARTPGAAIGDVAPPPADPPVPIRAAPAVDTSDPFLRPVGKAVPATADAVPLLSGAPAKAVDASMLPLRPSEEAVKVGDGGSATPPKHATPDGGSVETYRAVAQAAPADQTATDQTSGDPMSPSLDKPVDPKPAKRPPAPLAAGPVKTLSYVNMRAGPDGKTAVVKIIPTGTVVNVAPCKFWCEVVVGGQHGWVYRTFLGKVGGSVAGQ